MAEDTRDVIPERFNEEPEDTDSLPERADGPATKIELESEQGMFETIEEAPTAPLLDAYKETFKYLNREESPELFKLLQDMDIREMDGESLPIHKKEGSVVKVIGYFTHNNTPYLRVATRYWFGIPAHQAYSIENDVFNEDLPVTLSDKVKAGAYLTTDERRLATIAKTVATYELKKQKISQLTKSLFRRK
jgi:hypothetical protein